MLVRVAAALSITTQFFSSREKIKKTLRWWWLFEWCFSVWLKSKPIYLSSKLPSTYLLYAVAYLLYERVTQKMLLLYRVCPPRLSTVSFTVSLPFMVSSTCPDIIWNDIINEALSVTSVHYTVDTGKPHLLCNYHVLWQYTVTHLLMSLGLNNYFYINFVVDFELLRFLACPNCESRSFKIYI